MSFSNMIVPILNHLRSKNILLVSTSPRRRTALRQVGLIFNIQPSTFAEDLDITRFPTPADYVKETALEKSSLFERKENLSGSKPLDLVIAADTIIVLDNEVIGKPNDTEHAKRILERLSGRTHKVITGVALVAYERKTDDNVEAEQSANEIKGTRTKIHERVFHEETLVTFSDLTPAIIEAYVNTEEPMGKAGAYAIQGMGASLIKKIDGDYSNVVGLPIHKFCSEVMKLYQDGLL